MYTCMEKKSIKTMHKEKCFLNLSYRFEYSILKMLGKCIHNAWVGKVFRKIISIVIIQCKYEF